MKKAKAIILRTAGTNCDKETLFAFQVCGAQAELVHINQLISGERSLKEYNILAIPGGFSYGDDIAAGIVLANELKHKLQKDVQNFVKAGKLIIGICNGFQVLVKTGLLPHSTLTFNTSGKFEARWVYLKNVNRGNCIFTKDIDIIYLPVAHGEGKFITDKETLENMKSNDEVVFKYTDEKGKLCGYPHNPNDSMESIAGICSKQGNVFGLMPHPERFIIPFQHPHWTRLRQSSGGQARLGKNCSKKMPSEGEGIKIFKNAVQHAKKHL